MAESTIAHTFTGWGKPQLDLSTAQWQPGGPGAGDVQIAFVEGFIALRTGAGPGSRPLILAPDEWRAFVRGTRVGGFAPS